MFKLKFIQKKFFILAVSNMANISNVICKKILINNFSILTIK